MMKKGTFDPTPGRDLWHILIGFCLDILYICKGFYFQNCLFLLGSLGRARFTF